MKTFVLLFTAFSWLGCSSESIKNPQENLTIKDENAIISSTDGLPSEESEEEITAVPPTIISGSYLACNPLAERDVQNIVEVSCHIVSDGKIDSDVELSQSDIAIHTASGKIIPIDFVRHADGTISFKMNAEEIDDSLEISVVSIEGTALPEDVDTSRMKYVFEEEQIQIINGNVNENKSQDAATESIDAADESSQANEVVSPDQETLGTQASIMINNDDPYTNVEAVSLSLAADNATEMYVTPSLDCSDMGTWEPYATEKNWTLSQLNQETSVQVKYRDSLGNESACISDTIIHDSLGPSEPANLDDGMFTSSSTESTEINFGAAMDAETELAYYEASIGMSAGDSSVKAWSNIGNVTTVTFNDLDLQAGDIYFVNIRGVDVVGNTGNTVTSDGFIYNYCKGLGDGSNWIMVPANPDYQTDYFCAMKYEAKLNPDGMPESSSLGQPWVDISQMDAISNCSALGSGYHLITNPEWMAIATDINAVASNWSGQTVGIGFINSGHSDNVPAQPCPADSNDANAYFNSTTCAGEASGSFSEKRTHTLSNGELIWDLAGNVFEWTSYFNATDKPTPTIWDWQEYTAPVVGTDTMPLNQLISEIAILNQWNAAQGIGKYHAGENDGTRGALRRGGDFGNQGAAGVFSANIRDKADKIRLDTGFRCTKTIP